MLCADDLAVKTLGPCRIDSPLMPLLSKRQHSINYSEETDRILVDTTLSALKSLDSPIDQWPGLEPAGARKKIYFDPTKTRVGIVTCGGLCPGLNDVIRALTIELTRLYGVQQVYGFCNGYQGFVSRFARPVVELTPALVATGNENRKTRSYRVTMCR